MRQALQFLASVAPLIVSAQPSITVTSAVINGNITSTNTQDIRDLGFSGIIGSTTLNVYGDTLLCGNGSEYDRIYQVPPYTIYGANSAAIPSTTNKLLITDFKLNSVGSAQQFCPFNSEEVPNSDYGMGITNVIATSDTQGILYFLKNYRPNGNNDIIGAGIATVDITGAYPTCNRTSEYESQVKTFMIVQLSTNSYWWNAAEEPFWGDHGAVLASDGYVYVYGGANGTIMYDGLYVARVELQSATDLSTYQYYNGTSWSTTRLVSPTESNALLADLGQGQLHYNPYLGGYVYIYTCE
jgi:hypothetical protein